MQRTTCVWFECINIVYMKSVNAPNVLKLDPCQITKNKRASAPGLSRTSTLTQPPLNLFVWLYTSYISKTTIIIFSFISVFGFSSIWFYQLVVMSSPWYDATNYMSHVSVSSIIPSKCILSFPKIFCWCS